MFPSIQWQTVDDQQDKIFDRSFLCRGRAGAFRAHLAGHEAGRPRDVAPQGPPGKRFWEFGGLLGGEYGFSDLCA